jgi:hypothetical protein
MSDNTAHEVRHLDALLDHYRRENGDLKSQLMAARAALWTVTEKMDEVTMQRDAAHQSLASAREAAWEFVRVWQGGHMGREEEMTELVNAYMDDRRHWIGDVEQEGKE